MASDKKEEKTKTLLLPSDKKENELTLSPHYYKVIVTNKYCTSEYLTNSEKMAIVIAEKKVKEFMSSLEAYCNGCQWCCYGHEFSKERHDLASAKYTTLKEYDEKCIKPNNWDFNYISIKIKKCMFSTDEEFVYINEDIGEEVWNLNDHYMNY